PLELHGGGVVADFTLYGGPGGILTVYPGKTLEIIAVIGGLQPGGVLNNLGTVRKTGQGASRVYWALNNDGEVQVAEGILTLWNGGLSSGTYEVMDGAELNFIAGVQSMTNGVVFNTHGSGRLQMLGGTFNIASDLTIDPPFELTGGILDGDGDVTFNG